MKTKVYFTIEITEPIEYDSLQELKAKMFDKCAEILKNNPNSSVKDVVWFTGLLENSLNNNELNEYLLKD